MVTAKQEYIKKGHSFEQGREPNGKLWNYKKERYRNLSTQTLGSSPEQVTNQYAEENIKYINYCFWRKRNRNPHILDVYNQVHIYLILQKVTLEVLTQTKAWLFIWVKIKGWGE